MYTKAPETLLTGAAKGGSKFNAAWKRWGLSVKLLIGTIVFVGIIIGVAWSISSIANSFHPKNEGVTIQTMVGQVGNNNNQTVITPHVVVEPKPWRLSREQIDLLAQRMRPFAGDDDRHAWLKANTGNRDSVSMARDLAEALKAAGWKMGPGIGFESEPNWLAGVAVGVHEERDDPYGMSVFRQTMKEFGLDNNLYIREEVAAGRFEIHVGLKP